MRSLERARAAVLALKPSAAVVSSVMDATPTSLGESLLARVSGRATEAEVTAQIANVLRPLTRDERTAAVGMVEELNAQREDRPLAGVGLAGAPGRRSPGLLVPQVAADAQRGLIDRDRWDQEVAEIQAEHDRAGAHARALAAIREVLWVPESAQRQMSVGALVWAQSYALGKGREAAHAIAREVVEARIHEVEKRSGKALDDIELWTQQNHVARIAWCAAWAIGAFPQVTTTHTFAAALACTDVYPEVMANVRSPWPAWKLHIPNGLLSIPSADGRTFNIRQLEIEELPEGALMRAVVEGGIAAFEIKDETLALMLEDGAFEQTDDKSAVPPTEFVTVCRRLVAGIVLAMMVPGAKRETLMPARAAKKRQAAEPAHRNVVVGHPTKIDCRPALAAFLAGHRGRHRNGARGPAAFQFMVRGHWRRQACGTARMERKTIWIEPFWKSQEDMPILASPKRVIG